MSILGPQLYDLPVPEITTEEQAADLVKHLATPGILEEFFLSYLGEHAPELSHALRVYLFTLATQDER